MSKLWSWLWGWLWPPEKPKVPRTPISWPTDQTELNRVMRALLEAKEGETVSWSEAGKTYTLTLRKVVQIK